MLVGFVDVLVDQRFDLRFLFDALRYFDVFHIRFVERVACVFHPGDQIVYFHLVVEVEIPARLLQDFFLAIQEHSLIGLA